MSRQSRFQTLRSQSTMPYTYSSDEEESESRTQITYSVRQRRDMFRRRMSEFSADEKLDAPSMNGEVALVEPVRKQSGPGRITSPQSGFAGGTPPSGAVAAARTSVSRRAQMTSSEMSNQKHSISERELKSNFSEVKSAMSEMKATFESSGGSLGGSDMTVATSAPTGSAMAKLANCGLLNRGGHESYDVIPSLDGDPVSQMNGSAKNLKFQQTTSSSSQMKFMSNSGYSSEEAIANSSQKKTFQSDGVLYEEKSAEAAMKARIEMDGIKAEKAAAIKQEQKSLHTGDVAAQETRSSSSASMKLQSDNFTAEKMSTTFKNERNMVTTTGSYNQQSRTSATTKKQLKIEVQSIKTETTATTSQMNESLSLPSLDDLEKLGSDSNPNDIESAILKYTCAMSTCVDQLKSVQQEHMPKVLNHVHEMIRKAWLVPNFGHDLVDNLCNVLRMNGGLDILLANCTSNKDDLKLSSAKVLQQCLTQENRGYVVENALQKVVQVACNYAKEGKNPDHNRVGTGILEHLFKHNEMTCTDVVKLGGLDAVIRECRNTDVETLRHCAGALANLSLYGGTENQEHMIKRKVPYWLFPLAFHTDDNIKYYACLAIVVLLANKEIEGQVRKSEALNLVEPFVNSHDPIAFATTCATHRHGQNKSWLQRLVPVLTSEKEEARNLAAFHFCMEAGIKKKQGQEDVFREIGAIDPLKRVASSPSPIASKYAAQALRIIGEEVPHKLTPQVPLWSVEDVREWVKQVGFSEFCENFEKCQVDGDLLLQLTDENLRDDIGIKKAILRKKFLRELNAMKQKADYSSCDKNKVSEFLKNVDESFLMYTYNLLVAGVSKIHFRNLTDEQLQECGIISSIHRQRILEYVREDEGDCFVIDDKPVDVFISYRRSNGSQLASLLKVHLHLRGLSVFIDVDRLEAGKFDNNLLMSIRKAKTFILVLTPGSLDRCIDDKDGKDWVHREIVEALASDCNIIPVFDNFSMPDPAKLPEDMRQIVTFNGVTWIHEYQDACVEKIDKFIRREGDGSVIMNRYDPHLGLSTPSQSLLSLTPEARIGKPSYARTASSDSSKMAPCSNDILSLSNGQVRE